MAFVFHRRLVIPIALRAIAVVDRRAAYDASRKATRAGLPDQAAAPLAEADGNTVRQTF